MPHPPGSTQNKKLGDEIAKEWGTYMDKVEQFKHNIYLSYPTAPGQITLHHDNPNNFTKKTLVIENEPMFDESEKNNDKLLYPFNAFSASGVVTVSCTNFDFVFQNIFNSRNACMMNFAIIPFC